MIFSNRFVRPMRSALAFALLSWGCVHAGSELKSRLDPWLGKHPDQLVERWGAPESTYTMESGVKVLTYATSRTSSRSTGYGPGYYRFGNYSFTESCKMNFFTDASRKTIERYTTTGDDYACIEALREFAKPE